MADYKGNQQKIFVNARNRQNPSLIDFFYL